MKKLPKLSPTSYALLGLLARAPASAYELNTVMQTSLIRVYWPRAESHVYSEPKKLLAHGLVSELKEKTNGRQRTVYSITGQGRSTLADWLREDTPAELRSQAEFMLKLILADGGTAADAQKTLEKSLAASQAELEEAISGIEEILQHPGYAHEGMPWNGLVINLMADILIARYRWSTYALEAAQGVEDDGDPEDKTTLGREAYARALDKMRQALK